MEDLIDRVLKEKHEEAAKDFEKGDDKDGKNMDDRIGEIHDMISEMYADYKRAKTSKEKEDVEKEEIKKGEDIQRKEDKEDEKEDK